MLLIIPKFYLLQIIGILYSGLYMVIGKTTRYTYDTYLMIPAGRCVLLAQIQYLMRLRQTL